MEWDKERPSYCKHFDNHYFKNDLADLSTGLFNLIMTYSVIVLKPVFSCLGTGLFNPSMSSNLYKYQFKTPDFTKTAQQQQVKNYYSPYWVKTRIHTKGWSDLNIMKVGFCSRGCVQKFVWCFFCETVCVCVYIFVIVSKIESIRKVFISIHQKLMRGVS